MELMTEREMIKTIEERQICLDLLRYGIIWANPDGDQAAGSVLLLDLLAVRRDLLNLPEGLDYLRWQQSRQRGDGEPEAAGRAPSALDGSRRGEISLVGADHGQCWMLTFAVNGHPH